MENATSAKLSRITGIRTVPEEGTKEVSFVYCGARRCSDGIDSVPTVVPAIFSPSRVVR